MMHWATDLIGKPWVPGATGPDAFYCWGLVQWVYLHKLGVEFPQIEIEREGDNLRAMNVIRHAANMHRVPTPTPQEFDVIVMQGPFHKRHVGIMIRANGRLGVLHADGCVGSRGPQGSVMFHSLTDATAFGYGDYEFWRKQ